MIERIGKYRVVERIGQGGMGTVLKAHDPVLDRVVAIKLISRDLEVTADLRARFFREAQACARLNHPNIVTVHDLAEIEGQLVIVMEFLDGEELRQVIAQRRSMPLEDKIDLMIKVCDGLTYAHREGVVHRDIKPANILVLRNGGVKILDFGLARILNSELDLTRTGLIMGTLRYMAPEQARGRADHRADIFSIGAVFYELLAYRPAFPGDDPMEILETLRSYEPERLERLDPAIPVDLAETIALAMRKDPGARFADLAEMRHGLGAARQRLEADAKQLQARLHDRLERARQLETMVSERLGQPCGDETLLAFDAGRGVAALMALDERVARRIEDFQRLLEQASRLEPTVEHGLEGLRAGKYSVAIADLQTVVDAFPEHARAGAALQEARIRYGLDRRRREEPTQPASEAVRAPDDALATPKGAEETVQPRPDETVGAEPATVMGQPPSSISQKAPESATLLSPPPDDPRIERATPAVESKGADAVSVPEGRPKRRRSTRPGMFTVVTAVGVSVILAAGIYVVWYRRSSEPIRVTESPGSKAPITATADPMAADRRVVEDLRKRVAESRRQAEEAQARLHAASAFQSAAAHAQEGDRAAASGRFAEARARYEEALNGYGSATAEARQAPAVVPRETEPRRRPSRRGDAGQAAESDEAAQRRAPLNMPAARVAGEARAASAVARGAAEQIEAPRFASQTFQTADRLEEEGRAALGRSDYGAAQQHFQAAEKQYVAALGETRQRRHAELEQIGERSSAARQRAEQAGGDRYAAKQMTAARSKVSDAQAAVGRQDYSRAATLFREAESEFAEATRETRRLVARAEIERLQRDVVIRRDRAMKAGAETLVPDVMKTAQARERDGDGFLATGDYPASRQMYQDAVARYDNAVERAVALAGTQAQANQERAQMETEKQRAQRSSPYFADALRHEQDGTLMYQRLAFKEAGERFRAAGHLYARAVPPSPSTLKPTERLAPFHEDVSSEIHKVLADLKRAYESKDLALLQRIRPQLRSDELQSIRDTFDNARSYRLDLTIQTIAIQGNEAQARAFRQDVMIAKDGQIYRNESGVTVSFKRIENRWTVHDIK